MTEDEKLHEIVSKLKILANELGRTPASREFNKIVPQRQIFKHGYTKLCQMAGLEANDKKKNLFSQAPRILYFDIECTGLIVKTYGLYKQNIPPKRIIEDFHLLAYAANYHGEETHHYLDNRYSQNVKDDRQLIEGLHHLLINSDIVIGHNMDRFDLKKFNTRAALFGLAPIPKLNSHDTLKMLKKLFVLPSNSLWYAAKFFKLGNQKMLHSKFPGDELFDQCLEGNPEAWEELELYNIQDVKTTKELFLFLARYDESVNFSMYEQYNKCICGSTDFKRDGFQTKKGGKYARYRCKSCLKVFTLRCNEISAKIKSGIFS